MTNQKVTDLLRNGNEAITLTTGVKVKMTPAPSLLIEQAVSRIKFPDVPVQTLEDGRKVENPTHPDYLKARLEAIRKQSQVAIDVMIAFVDLVDEIPPDAQWVKRIRYLERLGHIDLQGYDLTDELDREFVYKKYIAFGSDDLQALSQVNGISEEDRRLARDTFRGP